MSPTGMRHDPVPPWQDAPNAPSNGQVLCPLDAVPDGGTRLLTLEAGNGSDTSTPPFRLILLRSGTNIHAYVNRCPHFGVPLSHESGRLILNPHVSVSCHVHYARFRWHDGLCIWGDCEGESLVRVPVRVTPGHQIVVGD
jgi:nitrite reductase/ring-hydroxylating ferredoxin subunit